MQNIRFGDITTVTSGLIVQGCNSQGKMNSGVAKAIREKFPDNFTTYENAWKEDGLKLGQVVVHIEPASGLFICNAIVQTYFGKDGRKYVSYEALQKAFKEVAKTASRYRLAVHYPLIGAGLGGGDWGIIQAIIDSVFDIHPAVQRTLWIQEQCATSNGTA